MRMTNCTSIDALITPFVDDALGAADRERVDLHLRACPACERRLIAEREARQALRRHAADLRAVPAPASLRSRLAEAAAQSAPVAPAGRARAVRMQLLRAAVAASLVLGGGLWLTAVVTRQSTTVLAAQLAADHVKCFLTNRDRGVLDPQPVAAFLRERYDFHATVPASDASLGLRLVGARRCLSGEGTNAHILYTWRGQPVSLYMLPGGAHARDTHDVLGQTTEMWAGHNGTYVLVMPDAAGSLAPLVAYMQQATATGYN
jgi:anti-sigma factor RsiW